MEIIYPTSDTDKIIPINIEDVMIIDIDITKKSGTITSYYSLDRDVDTIKFIIEKNIEKQLGELPEFIYLFYSSAERKYFVNLKKIEGWKIINEYTTVFVFKSGNMVSGYMHLTNDFKNKWNMYNP